MHRANFAFAADPRLLRFADTGLDRLLVDAQYEPPHVICSADITRSTVLPTASVWIRRGVNGEGQAREWAMVKSCASRDAAIRWAHDVLVALLDGDDNAEALYGQAWYTRPWTARKANDPDGWSKLPLALPELAIEVTA